MMRAAGLPSPPRAAVSSLWGRTPREHAPSAAMCAPWAATQRSLCRARPRPRCPARIAPSRARTHRHHRLTHFAPRGLHLQTPTRNSAPHLALRTSTRSDRGAEIRRSIPSLATKWTAAGSSNVRPLMRKKSIANSSTRRLARARPPARGARSTAETRGNVTKLSAKGPVIR